MRPESLESVTADENFVPECGRGLMLWGSRHYVRAMVRQQAMPEKVGRAFDKPLHRRLFGAVERVWEILLGATSERYILHDPLSDYLSLHEQLVMLEIDSLQSSNYVEFGASFAAVLPETALRAIEPEFKSLAKLVNVIDQANAFRAQMRDRKESAFLAPAQENRLLH